MNLTVIACNARADKPGYRVTLKSNEGETLSAGPLVVPAEGKYYTIIHLGEEIPEDTNLNLDMSRFDVVKKEWVGNDGEDRTTTWLFAK